MEDHWMRLANCCGIKAQTLRRFTPKWMSPPYIPWHCRGQEALDEPTPKGCPRLPDDASRAGVQNGSTRSCGVSLSGYEPGSSSELLLCSRASRRRQHGVDESDMGG